MSVFSQNITARRKQLGLTIEAITEELNRRGVDVAQPTVAGWFNASRGKRWKMDELKVLMDVLGTTFDDMSRDEVALVEGSKAKVQLGRKIHGMSEERAQALLVMLEAMESKNDK